MNPPTRLAPSSLLCSAFGRWVLLGLLWVACVWRGQLLISARGTCDFGTWSCMDGLSEVPVLFVGS